MDTTVYCLTLDCKMMMGMVELVYNINDSFTYTKREDLSIFIPHVFQSIYFEVQNNKNKPIILGVIYRPNSAPRADIDMFMSKIIEIQDKMK